MSYKKRELESKLQEYLSFFSVVAITGPRQSGKSTLIQTCLEGYRYVTFDHSQNVNAFYDDPEKFMRVYDDKVIFDEAQKVPELFDAIKLLVDRDRKTPGKFVLTGSSQFALSTKITESLAGRIGNLELLPYEYSEMPKPFRSDMVFRGGFPELVEKKYALFDDWFASYIQTYIEKDVRTLSHIGDLRNFQRLLQMLAANTAQVLNASSYATQLGVDTKTVQRWISILEASYILFLLPPYHKNLGKRIVKSPKVYFYDVGIVSHLCGLQNRDLFEKGPLYGPLFENYLVAEIMKKNLHRKTHSKLYYYRTSHGKEVDLILDKRSHIEWIEIKTSETFKPAMAAPMESLRAEGENAFLLYRGKTLPSVDNLHVMNYEEYLQLHLWRSGFPT